MRALSRTLVFTVLLISSACAAERVISAAALVARVVVQPSTATIPVGGHVQAQATVLDSAGHPIAGAPIAWSSANASIAQVVTSGDVTAIAAGTATITASSGDHTASLAVTVTLVPTASVSVAPSAPSMTVGQTTQLTATPRDASGGALTNRVIAWSSSNSQVASVSGSGLVTAAAAGNAVITATCEGRSGSASVTVAAAPPPPVASVSVAPASASLTVGQTSQLTATPRDASGAALSGRVVTWTTSNGQVATVTTAGLVRAIAAGSATIPATSEGRSGTASVTVTAAPPVPVATVTVSPATASVQAGQTVQLTAVTRDAGGNVLTGRTIVWSSANNGTATVSSTGLVTGVAAAQVVITATSEGRSGQATITVTAAPPSTRVDTIFSETFEGGTLASWDDGVDATKHRVLTNATLAHSGSRVLEVTYPQGADGGWMTHFFMPGYDSAYVRYYVRFEPNWVGATKLIAFYGSRIDNQWSAFGRAGQCPNGTDFFAAMLVTETSGNPGPVRFYTYYPAMMREPDGVTCWGRWGSGRDSTYYPPMTLSTGSWHLVEFWVKLNAPGQNNADEKFWIDGVLRGEWHNISIRSTTDLRINSFQLTYSYANSNNASPQTQRIYVDDVLVTRQMPR